MRWTIIRHTWIHKDSWTWKRIRARGISRLSKTLGYLHRYVKWVFSPFKRDIAYFCSNRDPFHQKPSVMWTFTSANQFNMEIEDPRQGVFAFLLLVTIVVDFVCLLLIDHQRTTLSFSFDGPVSEFQALDSNRRRSTYSANDHLFVIRR